MQQQSNQQPSPSPQQQQMQQSQRPFPQETQRHPQSDSSAPATSEGNISHPGSMDSFKHNVQMYRPPPNQYPGCDQQTYQQSNVGRSGPPPQMYAGASTNQLAHQATMRTQQQQPDPQSQSQPQSQQQHQQPQQHQPQHSEAIQFDWCNVELDNDLKPGIHENMELNGAHSGNNSSR